MAQITSRQESAEREVPNHQQKSVMLEKQNFEGLRILFICGSIEPGKDGVGDYTFRLAGELMKQGHQLSIVALNDKFIQNTYEGLLSSEGFALQVLRLPATLNWHGRKAKILSWVSYFNPEWISLQYVPYSFSKKGVPFFLSRKLKEIGAGRKWHFMFHELWLGMEMQPSFKNKIIGNVQQLLIRSLVRKVKPATIHTQIQLYQIKLKKLGLKAQILPLFGNISTFNAKVKTAASDENNHRNKLRFILFGGIHPDTPVEQFASEMAAYAKKTNTEVSLIMIGRNGEEQERWKKVWVSSGFEIEILGEQDPQVISREMQKATIGIATTPLLLIEKSGSAIAMQEHGLPVLCISKAWDVEEKNMIQIPDGVFEYQPGSLAFFLDSKPTCSNRIGLADVASNFVHSLTTLQ